MKWPLEGLKILARNETVPGIALRDAIGEIDRLQTVVARLHEELPKKLARNEDEIVIRMIGTKKFRRSVITLIANVLEDFEAEPGNGYSLSSSIEPE